MFKISYRHLISLWKQLVAVARTKGVVYVLQKIFYRILSKLTQTSLSYTKNLFVGVKSTDAQYDIWLQQNYPRKSDFIKIPEVLEALSYQPLISIIIPVFKDPEHFLHQTIESVVNQIYTNWEICIVNNDLYDDQVLSLIDKYVKQDYRIRLINVKEVNGFIWQSLNRALEEISGEFISLIDQEDLITPDALYEVVLLLNRYKNVDLIYSDADKITEDGILVEPFFKPDWCPDSFLSRMYTGNLSVYRSTLVKLLGGFRIEYVDSCVYDLVLRLIEKTESIFHIPRILYHERLNRHTNNVENIISRNEFGQSAISDALKRRGEEGSVICISDNHYIVRYKITDFNLVSIIIPTRNLGKVLDRCLASIFEKTTYPNYEVLVIDNGSDEEETFKVIKKWENIEPNRFKCERLDIPFNFSKINNYAVSRVKGDFLLFLNNDTEVITPDWIDAMVEQSQRPSIGAVGALLLYPDDTIQHAGVILVYGLAGHSHKYYKYGDSGYFNYLKTVNNYSAVTAACLMCRRDVFDKVGGFEEDLAVAFNDVDLCFKFLKQGHKNVFLPHVVLYHYESKTRGNDDTAEKVSRNEREVAYMKKKWAELINHDPHYSINLTRSSEDFRLNI